MIDVMLELFLSPERPFSLVLNLLIAALTVIAISLSIRVMVGPVRMEREAIQVVRRLSFPNQEAIKAALVRSDSHLAQRVEDMAEYSAAGHPIDAASLTGLNTVSFRQMLELPAALGRSMIVLGLFGTLWGLGVAVTGLASTLSSGGMTAEALASAILGTLGGMQTAFSTTLVGIVGSLLTATVVGWVRSQQTEVLAEVERVMSTKLIPQFDTTEASILTSAAAALQAIQIQAAEDMKQVIGAVGQEGGRLREQLEREFARIEDAFETRAERLIESTGRALAATLSILGEREDGEPTLAEYVRTVRTSVERLQEAVHSASGMMPAIEAGILHSIERHRTGLEEVLTSHRNDLGPVMDRHSLAVEKFAATAEKGTDQTVRSDELLRKLMESLDEAARSWGASENAVVEMGQACRNAIREGLSDVVAEIRESQEESTLERDKVLKEISRFEEVLDVHLKSMIDERASVIRQTTELVGALRDATTNAILQVGLKLEAKDSTAARQLVGAVERLSQELRDLVGRRSSSAFGGDGYRSSSDLPPLSSGPLGNHRPGGEPNRPKGSDLEPS